VNIFAISFTFNR